MFPEDRALGQILLQGNSAYGRAQWGWGLPGLNPGGRQSPGQSPPQGCRGARHPGFHHLWTFPHCPFFPSLGDIQAH